MESIKGGTRKAHRIPKRRQDDDPKENYVDRRKQVPEDEGVTTIKVSAKGPVSSVVPGSVWRQPPFPWRPRPFGLESEKLTDKIIDEEAQEASLRLFMEDPERPLIYSISGNPADTKAKYFAAYLVAAHIKAVGIKANPVWYPIYEGFGNPLMEPKDESSPSLIVLTNLTLNASNMKLSKARDIIEKYDSIPRLIVSAGCDPISFTATKLYCEVNAMAYFAESMVKQRVEIL